MKARPVMATKSMSRECSRLWIFGIEEGMIAQNLCCLACRKKTELAQITMFRCRRDKVHSGAGSIKVSCHYGMETMLEAGRLVSRQSAGRSFQASCHQGSWRIYASLLLRCSADVHAGIPRIQEVTKRDRVNPPPWWTRWAEFRRIVQERSSTASSVFSFLWWRWLESLPSHELSISLALSEAAEL